MKSLASIHDAVDVMYGRLNGDYVQDRLSFDKNTGFDGLKSP